MTDKNAEIKKNLAYAYRINSYLGLDDHTYTHLSSRSAEGDSFYIYPFGLRFEEVTPDTLLKVDFDGQVLEGKEEQYNKTGYVIHGNIYKAREDINSIFHTHTPATAAVSAMKQQLMWTSQWALHFYGKVAYHDYDSLALNHDQGDQLVEDLGDKYVMLMCNHGALMCGRTVHEAMFYTYHLEQACKTQCLALAAGKENLIEPAKEICEKTVQDIHGFEKDIGMRDWKAWTKLIDRKGGFQVK
jgi:ribulose-5-phosphate 4-epimerase/fuculose-1-phosphate aldolase